jgi:hypothetical protein
VQTPSRTARREKPEVQLLLNLSPQRKGFNEKREGLWGMPSV